jgi:hypothetical protein
MLRTALIAAALTVLVAVAPAPAPAATLAVRGVGTAGPTLHAGPPGVVVSTIAPGQVEAHTVATGAHAPVAAPGPDCALTDSAGTSLLWQCATGSGLPDGVVTDLVSGAAFPLAPPATYLDPARDSEASWASYEEIGTRWLRIVIRGYHWQRSRFVDRATGAARRPDPPDARADTDVDLDDPALVHHLCAGVRRLPVVNPAFPIDEVPGPIVRRGGTAVAVTGKGLTLMRCGKAPRLLDRCRRSRCAPVVDARVVAWATGDLIRVYDRRTGRITTRELAGAVTSLVSAGAPGALAASVAGAAGPATGPYRLVAITAR